MGSVKLLLKIMWRRMYSQNPIFDEFLRGKKMLDVGCGQGEILRLAKDLGTGLDLNARVVNELKNEGLNIHLGNACSLPFEGEMFDVVNCKNVIEHLLPEDARKMLAEMARVLKPGGQIVLMTPTEYTVWNTFGHVKPYTPAAVSKLFRKQSLESFDSINNLSMENHVYLGKWSGRLAFFTSCWLCQGLPWLRGMYLMIITKK